MTKKELNSLTKSLYPQISAVKRINFLIKKEKINLLK